MNGELFISSEIFIDAPAIVVWQMLTHPQQTKKYMFGCEAVTDWKPGSPLEWIGHYEGEDIVFVKGKVVDIIPCKKLSYTTIDPQGGMKDIPENYLTVTYELQEEGGLTHLRISQGDYSLVADGEKRYNDSVAGGGWTTILGQIKKLVEEEN